MDSPVLASKNKSQKNKNFQKYSPMATFGQLNLSNQSNSQTSFIMAYFVMEGKINKISQFMKKIIVKQKMICFQKIYRFQEEKFGGKNQQNGANLQLQSILKKNINHIEQKTHNPQVQSKERIKVCMLQLNLKLQTLMKNLQMIKYKRKVFSWSKIKINNWIINFEHKTNIEELQITKKPSSKISSKRKTTKKEELKENSNINISDLVNENEKIQNDIKQDEQDKEVFVQEMLDLLDYHSKFLNQGSNTQRNRKTK